MMENLENMEAPEEEAPKQPITMRLHDLLELAISSEEVGTVNFNVLRILLADMIQKLEKVDSEPVSLGDMESRQIQNYKNYASNEDPGLARISVIDMKDAPKHQRQRSHRKHGHRGGGHGHDDHHDDHHDSEHHHTDAATEGFVHKSEEPREEAKPETPFSVPGLTYCGLPGQQQLLQYWGLPGQALPSTQPLRPFQQCNCGLKQQQQELPYLGLPGQHEPAPVSAPCPPPQEPQSSQTQSQSCCPPGHQQAQPENQVQQQSGAAVGTGVAAQSTITYEPPQAQNNDYGLQDDHLLLQNLTIPPPQQEQAQIVIMTSAVEAPPSSPQENKPDSKEHERKEDDSVDKEDIQTLFSNLANVIAECNDQKERIDQLVDVVRIIESGMVTKQFLMDMISDKADKGQINTKVSYDEFGNTVDELHAQLHNLMVEGYQRNENWKKITADLSEELSEKLDKVELSPIRAFFKSRLKKLEDRVVSLCKFMEAPDPAGTRKQLKEYNCLSCDRKVNISGFTNTCTLPNLGPATAIPSNASHRTYDLHRLRNQRNRFDPVGKEAAALEKQMKSPTDTGRKSQTSDKNMMEIVNRYVGSNSQNQNVLPSLQKSAQVEQPQQAPALSTVASIRVSEQRVADYGMEE